MKTKKLLYTNFKGVILTAAADTMIPMIIIVGVVFVLYFGTATKWTFRPGWTVDYINPMAKALQQGRLDISDPAMTYDLIRYQGAWYTPWGILTPLVHIPFQLVVGGRYVPALYTGLLFGSLTVGAVWFMLERIRLDWFPASPTWTAIVIALLYAFGTMQFYVSTVGSVWHVNQTVSTFFAVLGVIAILKKKRVLTDYGASVAWCIVAFLGRPTLAFLTAIPLFLFFEDARMHGMQARSLLMIFVPFLLGVCLFFLYNFVRFGSPLETGYRYIQEDATLEKNRMRYGMFSFAYSQKNLWHMIVAPPRIHWKKGLTLDIDLMGNSIFLLSPLLFFALGTLPRIRSNPVVRAAWLGIAVTAAASLLYYNTGWMQFGYRYALDFSFLLVVLTYMGLRGRLRWWTVPLFLFTLWVNYTGIRLLQ